MKDAKEPTSKVARQRSPNYPATSLPESLVDIRAVYEKEKRTLLNQDSVVRAMGYAGLNGASRSKLASLRKYGLLDEVGGGLQVSQLALRIICQSDMAADRQAAVKEAALRPDIFSEFYETHREASEQSIQSELILKRDFSPEGAKVFAKTFRETILFAKLDLGPYSPSNGSDEIKDTPENDSKPPAVKLPNPNGGGFRNSQTPSVLATYSFPIGQETVVKLEFTGTELAVDHFDALGDFVELIKKQFERASKSKAQSKLLPPLPANAMWKNKDSNTPVRIVALMGEKDGVRYFQSEDGTGLPESELVF